MDITPQDDLKTHLLATDEEFRRLAEEHAAYKRQVAAIEAKNNLTMDDEMEEHRLKKLKLQTKDQMAAIMGRHQAHVQHA